jgi:DNA-directed RNA polymerase specialized sigma24 family protein
MDELLEVCLSYLPRKLHWTFLFKYRDQLTKRQIAYRTGMEHRTVRRHLHRALAILRDNKRAIADLVF